MNKAELQAKIDDLESHKFLINMSDRLTQGDKEALERIDEELKALKAQIQQLK